MRVLYLANTPIPGRSAKSVNVMKMCQAFARNGPRVMLVTRDLAGVEPGVADPFAFCGVARCFRLSKLTITGPGRSPLVKARLQLALFLVLFQPYLIYARNHSLEYDLPALKKPFVLECHRPPADARREFSALLASPFLRRIVANCGPLRDVLVGEFGAPGRLTCVAHNGADAPAGVSPAALGEDAGRLRVGYVGGLFADKGIGLILELAWACPWAHFYLVGESGEAIATWQRQAASLANVSWLGFKPHAETDAYRLAMDVLLAPYLPDDETVDPARSSAWLSPVKVFEYMAAGRAFIASDLSTMREVVTHQHDGWLCPPGDLAAWQQALVTLAEIRSLREALGRQAQQTFSQNHTWRQRAQMVLPPLL